MTQPTSSRSRHRLSRPQVLGAVGLYIVVTITALFFQGDLPLGPRGAQTPSCMIIAPGTGSHTRFLTYLSRTCQSARLRGKTGPLAPAAQGYLDQMTVYAKHLATIGRVPSDAGAFLIARQDGTLRALGRYVMARKKFDKPVM